MKTIKAFIKKHPVLSYFALTFAISWGGVLLVIGGPSGIPGSPEQFERLLPFAIPVMIVGPGVAGLLLTGLVQGRAGFRELLSRLLKWRVGARWYAVAFVFHYFRKWRLDGTWERLNRTIRERLRVRLGRDPQPSAGIVDSQSAKTTGVGGEQRGFDGGKKVRGRKRHLLVDTEGLVVEARVHSAKIPDQDGIRRLLEPACSRLERLLSYLWVDAGYRGRGKEWVERALGVEVKVVNRSPKPPPEKILRIWAREWFKEGREMDLSKLPTRPGFENLPRRWVAERTFARITHNRRMAKDFERLCSAEEAFIHAAMTRLMVRRLARS